MNRADSSQPPQDRPPGETVPEKPPADGRFAPDPQQPEQQDTVAFDLDEGSSSSVVSRPQTADEPVLPDRYALLEWIADGGMGEVYRACDLRLDRPVAVKIIRREFQNNQTVLKRFWDEARVTGRLQHPGIPPVHDLGTLSDGRPFLAMKLIQGQTLGILLRRRSTAAEDQTRFVHIFEQLCHALGYAHAHGIIHRDLKPSNVMIGAHGEVQVMDWGLAKDISAQEEDSGTSEPDAEKPPQEAGESRPASQPKLSTQGMGDSATRMGTVLGTPGYMAPEQAAGKVHQLDARTDVFALGAILYEILTARRLYRGRDSQAVFLQAQRCDTREAFSYLENCEADAQLRRLCRRCLSPEPEDRPADANAVAAEVARIRQAAQHRARQAELQAHRARILRRVAVGAVGATVLLAVLAAAAVVQWHTARESERQALLDRNRAREAERQARDSQQRAELQRNRAMEAERRAKESEAAAKRQSQLALETLNQVIFDVQHSLKNLAGGGSVRRRLLQTVLKRLDRIATEYVEQSLVDRSTMVALQELGDVLMQFGHGEALRSEASRDASSPIRSPVAAAHRLYDQAYRIAQQLAQAAPQDTGIQRDLSVSLEKLGDASLQLGRVTQALEHFRQSQAIRHRLAQAHPDNLELQGSLAVSLDRLGDVALRMGKPQQAQRHYRQSLLLRQRLAQAEPDNPQRQHALTVSLNKLGDVDFLLGNVSEATGYYRRALAVRKELVQAHPDNTRFQRDLTVSLERLGDIYFSTHQLALALDHYRQALAIDRKRAQAEPNNLQAQRDLTVSLDRLGTISARLGKPAQALEYYRQALAIDRKLAQAAPNDAQAQRNLSVSLARLGDVNMQLGQATKATEYYTQSLAIRRRLALADPNDVEAQDHLAMAYVKLGDAHFYQRKLPAARDFYLRALEIGKKLPPSVFNAFAAQQQWSVVFARLGGICLQSGKPAEAVDYYRQGLAIDKQRAHRNPDDRQIQRELALSHYHLGRAYRLCGQYAKALQQLQAAANVLERLPAGQGSPQPARRLQALFRLEVQQTRLLQVAAGPWDALMQQPKNLLPALLAMRSGELARQGPQAIPQIVQTARTLEQLAAEAPPGEKNNQKGGLLYHAACSYALAARLAAGWSGHGPWHPQQSAELTAEQKKALEPHAKAAIGALQRAVQAGWSDLRRASQEPALDIVRQRPAFRKLFQPDGAEKPASDEP